MAKTERRKGDYIYRNELTQEQQRCFVEDCVSAGATRYSPFEGDFIQWGDDNDVDGWWGHPESDGVNIEVTHTDVTHEYTQQSQQITEPVLSPQKTLERLQGVYDIRGMSLAGLIHNSELRQEFTTIADILFDDGKDWWDISKQIAGTTMIDTEKVLVIEMLYSVIHDAIIEYHNNDKVILGEIFEEAEHKIKHISTHLPFAQESVLYDWWAEFKQRYTLPCEDINEQSVLDMLSKAEGLTVELNKDGIVVYDHHLESEASVNTLDEAKDIIQGKQSYTKAFN